MYLPLKKMNGLKNESVLGKSFLQIAQALLDRPVDENALIGEQVGVVRSIRNRRFIDAMGRLNGESGLIGKFWLLF